MLRTLLAFAVVAVAAADASGQILYNNYTVFRLKPTTQDQLNFIRQLKDGEDYTFWTEPNYVNKTTNLMVSPTEQKKFIERMKELQIRYQETIRDVQSLIDNESKKPTMYSRSKSHEKYRTLEEITSYLYQLSRLNPKQVEIIIGGRTFEGRRITGVKLFGGQNKTRVVFEAGMHAREWIAPATLLYLIDQLLTSKDDMVRNFADSYEFHVFPVINADGYVYSHTKDRMWRKSRSRTRGSSCIGTDLNRNFDFKWNVAGASRNPCVDLYCGSGPASEIETKTFSNYVTSISKNMVAYFSFHAYSQILMFPYGYTKEKTRDYDELKEIGKVAVEAIQNRHGKVYKVDNIARAVYLASGSSVDWARGVANVPLAFAYELRDEGQFSFMLPSDQIIPTGEEVLDSLVALFHEAKKRNFI